jgi:hypothetical protein|tara:strand:+ start:429 stop:668 length:240 start_codon:yes stop_codon:yes gene_type:complete
MSEGLLNRIEELKKQLEETKLELDMCEQVKNSEKQMNLDLKELIENLNLHNKTLCEINENFSKKISKLRVFIKDKIDNI